MGSQTGAGLRGAFTKQAVNGLLPTTTALLQRARKIQQASCPCLAPADPLHTSLGRSLNKLSLPHVFLVIS